MITENEYAQLVQYCLERLRMEGLDDVAFRLLSIINKPIIDEPDLGRKSSKHISEAKERPPTAKEQLQAIIAFMEARLVHSAYAALQLSEMTRHSPTSIKWIGGEDAEGKDFSARDLLVSPLDLAEAEKHLLFLRQAAEMTDELD